MRGLHQLNQEWRALHEKTEPLVESLKKYHQLPPVRNPPQAIAIGALLTRGLVVTRVLQDITLARIKIEDARREVARLNQQISDALARMNISYH